MVHPQFENLVCVENGSTALWLFTQRLGFCSKVKVKTVTAPALPLPSPANIKKYYPALTDVAKMDGAFLTLYLANDPANFISYTSSVTDSSWICGCLETAVLMSGLSK